MAQTSMIRSTDLKFGTGRNDSVEQERYQLTMPICAPGTITRELFGGGS